MGLRDRYLSALVARCAVAVPRECNTQQPAKLLRVAAPRETQRATSDAAPVNQVPADTGTWLHATNQATVAQRTQHAIVRADDVKHEQAEAWGGLLSRTEPEIVAFKERETRITWLGYSHAAGLAEGLLQRDRDGDDRRLCVECAHVGPGWRCAKREAFLLNHLQRCPMFKERTS